MVTFRRNRIVLLFLGLLFSVGVYSQPILPGVIASSSLKHLADIADESFDATGYDLTTAWSETEGSGSSVDEDNTDITDENGDSDNILLIDKVSPNFDADTRLELDPSESVSYLQVYINPTTESLSDSDYQIIKAWDASWGTVYSVYLKDVSGTLYLMWGMYNDGSNSYYTSSTVISLSTWYKIEVKWDLTGNTYEWKIDDFVEESGSLTGTLRGDLDKITLGTSDYDTENSIYFNNLKVSSTGYPTE